MNAELPQILYKYRNWKDKYHKRLIINNELYFSSIDQFNDPFDSIVPLSFELIPKEKVRKKYFKYLKYLNPNLNREHRKLLTKLYIKSAEFYNPERQKWHKKYQIKYRIKEYGIFSLSSEKDNIIMWSHYSDSHRGYCIGYYRDKIMELRQKIWIENKIQFNIHKVEYKNEYPKYDPTFMTNEEMIIKPLYTKSKDWKYENEYRLICIFRSKFSININDDIIAEVILGCKMPDCHKKEIINIIKTKNFDIPIFEAKLKENQYGLDFHEIKV